MRTAEGLTRKELAASYARPYRRWLPLGLRLTQADIALTAAVVAGVVVTVLDLSPLLLAPAIAALAWSAWWTAAWIRTIRARTRHWRARDTALDRVRRERPHADAQDAEMAHDEYAAVIADGKLVTWCFVPLHALQPALGEETLVPGKPRYAAAVVAQEPYATPDPERVSLARAAAAEWEAAAARDARAAREG